MTSPKLWKVDAIGLQKFIRCIKLPMMQTSSPHTCVWLCLLRSTKLPTLSVVCVVTLLSAGCGSEPSNYQGDTHRSSKELVNSAVRRLLEGVSKLYIEPGALVDRQRALELLGVRSIQRHNLSHPMELGPVRFFDRLGDGIFSEAGWSGDYEYQGWADESHKTWSASIHIEVNPAQRCLTIGGVKQQFAPLNIEPRSAKLASNAQDGAELSEVLTAPSTGSLNPELQIRFSVGCLTDIVIHKTYFYSDISDEKSRN